MKKIFIPTPLADAIVIPREETHHLLRVFRHPQDKPVVVGGSDGRSGVYQIIAVEDGCARAHCLRYCDEDMADGPEIILMQAFLKGDRFEWVLQKATELGVNRIYAVKTENCVVKYTSDKLAGKKARWEKIIREAGQQCGRMALPSLVIAESMHDVCAEEVCTEEENVRWLVAYEDEDKHTLRERLEEATLAGCDRIGIIIGPEGGFDTCEIEALMSVGVYPVSLGDNILRAETAAVAAVSMISYHYMK